MSKNKVNCFQCKHFFITWDPKTPKGCRAYGVKSAQIPSVIVAQASAQGCLAFADKAQIKKDQATKVDLNNDDLW